MPDVSSICPKRIRAGDWLLPCMGSFSIFLVGSHNYVRRKRLDAYDGPLTHLEPNWKIFIYTRLSDVDSAEAAYGDRALLLCAIAEGEIVGTGAIKRLDNRECEMVRMFVALAYRSRGIGWTIVARRMG